MAWLIIIGIILVVGYYWLKNSAIKQQQASEERISNKMAEHKEYLDNYFQNEYREALRGDNSILHDKQSIIDYMIRRETERRLLHLWSKHVTTVMVSDKYSKESRNNLYIAWYRRLSSEVSYLEAIPYMLEDPSTYHKEISENYQTFKATLEAFDYDPDQEEKDTDKQVAKEIKNQYTNTPLRKKAKKPVSI